jgi:uncharacterized protein
MALKSSMFNYVFEKDDSIFLYNTYTMAIAKSHRNTLIKKILEDPSATDEEGKGICDQMVKDGFLVESSSNEDALANLRHFDIVAQKSLALTILPTMQCNFECKYCYLTTNDPITNDFVMNKETQDNLIKFLKKNINEYDSLGISWFGGEPSIVTDVINNLSGQMIKICRDRYKPYTAFMTTNGYNLTLDVFKRMLENKITGYQITLDGPRELHDKLRVLKNGKPTFDRILNNLRDIRDHVKSSTITITIRTNVTMELINKIESYLEFLEKEFGGDHRFSFFFKAASNWGGERVKGMKDSLPDSLGGFYEKLISSKHQLNYRELYNFLFNGICLSARRNDYTIGFDGKVYKCTLITDDELIMVGSINQKGQILLDEEKIAKWVYRFDNLKEKCRKCCFRPRCYNSRCPASGLTRPVQDKCDYDSTDIDKIIQLIANGALKSKNGIIKHY